MARSPRLVGKCSKTVCIAGDDHNEGCLDDAKILISPHAHVCFPGTGQMMPAGMENPGADATIRLVVRLMLDCTPTQH